MKTEIIIQIIISFAMIIILALMLVLFIQQMEQRIMEDCEKQNFKDIKKYWDLDINCSQFKNNYVNETRMVK
jgi:uncharacterized membrane protein